MGVSTENLWWGPGVRNSLIMSNNAPGFGHISFNTTAPVLTKIGSFEWQLISGVLQNSGLLPPDTARTFNGQKLYEPQNGKLPLFKRNDHNLATQVDKRIAFRFFKSFLPV